VITLKGQGNAVKDGASGDINVTVKIIIPPPWRRKGKDLYTEVHVPYYHAILGGKIKVTTATGEEKELLLEPGTQPDQEYILANEGVPDKSGRYRGDLHVTIKVDLPSRELLPHKREYYMSKICPVEYKPSSKAPRWMDFLNTITGGSNELVRYLQKL